MSGGQNSLSGSKKRLSGWRPTTNPGLEIKKSLIEDQKAGYVKLLYIYYQTSILLGNGRQHPSNLQMYAEKIVRRIYTHRLLMGTWCTVNRNWLLILTLMGGHLAKQGGAWRIKLQHLCHK